MTRRRLRGDAGSARRIALWQLGVATPGRRVPGGVQLALPLDLPAPPELRELTAVGVDAGRLQHDRADGRRASDGAVARAAARGLVTSRELAALRHGTRVRVGGLVVARQRPGTANGIVFVLLEDEYGTINLIVPAQVYERHRLTVRTEPLVLAEGKMERLPAAGGAINVLVDRVEPIAAPDHIAGRDQGLLDAGRAGAPGLGREEQRRTIARNRRGGLPSRGAACAELRIGAAAIDPFAG